MDSKADNLRLLLRGTNLRVKDVKASVQAIVSPPTATVHQLGKRKREEPETTGSFEPRAILKRNKIKVTDLGALRKARENDRTVRKENFLLYPDPVTTFDQLHARFGIRPSLARNIADQGYVEPTEVQMVALPLLLEEEPPNLLTVAPTGSGKTAAFLIPLVQRISERRRQSGESHVTALVLAPTKELVVQIVNEARKLTANTGVNVSAVRKGMRIAGCNWIKDHHEKNAKDTSSDAEDEQANPIEVKSDILVTSPLALLRALASSEESLGATLPHIQNLILDEADVLLDERFRKQTLAAWKACTSTDLQISLWSATMGSNIEEMSMDTVRNHHTEPSSRHFLRCVIGLKDSAVLTVTHRLVFAGADHHKLWTFRNTVLRLSPDDKRARLRFPILVYTQTIERAIALHTELRYEYLSEVDGSERTAVLHSDLSETKRAEVMKRFRAGQIWMLFTTDLLSRGIDFRGVNGIVNYDVPTTAAAYVHRVGRTGRAGREGGLAVTMFTAEDAKCLKQIANVIAASERAKGGSWEDVDGFQGWMLEGLEKVSKKDRKELKERGVLSRRGVREGDDSKVAKAKRKARIGTKTGYLLQKENNLKGAIQASKKRKQREGEGQGQESDEEDSEWNGF